MIRVNLVYVTNAERCQVAAGPQSKPTDLSRKSTCRLEATMTIIRIQNERMHIYQQLP